MFGFLLLLSRITSRSKVRACFSSGFLCSFLFPPEAHERKERSASLPTALPCLFFLNSYPSYPYIGVSRESSIYLLIGQGALNASVHYHSAILNNLFPCFFPTISNYIKHSVKNVLRPYSINFLLHIHYILCPLFHSLSYELAIGINQINDAVVILGVLVLQATALKDL